MSRITKCVAVLGAIAAFGVAPAMGQVITFDEFGNGSFGAGFIGPDPGPGGLQAVLTYPLAFAGTAGDLLIHDPLEGGLVLDVVRWNGNGRLYFYSDDIDGVDAPADTPSPPTQFYANQANANEGGAEGGLEDVFYTPLAGQPGFDPGNPNWTYHLISDVPEPATCVLISIGVMGLAAIARRRKSAA